MNKVSHEIHIGFPLQLGHNERDGVSNHQPHDCLLSRFSGAGQRKHQSSASLGFVRGIHRWPVNSPHKGLITRKMTLLRTSFRIAGLMKTYREVTSLALGYHMMTSSNGSISASLAIYAGNLPVTGKFPAQRPVTRSVDVFFDLLLNKRLRKQSWGWWFATPSRSLWRHCNDFYDDFLHWINVWLPQYKRSSHKKPVSPKPQRNTAKREPRMCPFRDCVVDSKAPFY